MRKLIVLFSLVIGTAFFAAGQCGSGPILTVNNPSFEGPAQPHVTPPGWDICMPGVTPDTQPGSWGCTLPPSNGSSYIGLVYAPSINWQEGAGQTLSSPMTAGTTYNFTIDLATMASADPATGIVLPPWCDQLQLWGGMSGVNSGCDQSELLWTSPVISNSTWITYNLSFTPTQNWNHILFLIYAAPPACTDGQYLLMDNMTSIIPVADLPDFNWTAVCPGTPMQFTDQSVANQGTIASWLWDFGDGGTGNTQNPSHTYMTPGTYDVELTIITSIPCTTSITQTVTVLNGPTVVVSGGGAICSGVGTTVPVTFTFTGTGPWDLTYTDGTTPTTVNGIATSPYTINVSTAGTYTATAISDANCTGSISGSAVVTVNNSPNVNFNALPMVCIDLAPFALSGGTPSGGTYSGTGVSNNTFDPTAAGAGIHTITYTYTDPITTCTGSAQQTITVGTNMSVIITPTADTICPGASTVLTCTPGDQIHWYPTTGLSDSTTALVTASPTTTTTYTVTVTNASGCSGSATAIVYSVDNANLVAQALPPDGCEPLHVDFLFNPGPNIVDSSWVWFFNDIYSDTTFSLEQQPSHFFSHYGLYKVILNATTTEGCFGTDTIMVQVNPNPIADFIMHPDIADMEDPTVSFVDVSSNSANWFWDFGDPASGNDNWAGTSNPTHTFSDSGTYNVMLVVTSSEGCIDTIIKPITIYPQLLIFIPNAFTPDNNGLNDIWMPTITGFDTETFDMSIYDRWGKEIFKSLDLHQGWNGKGSDGKICMEGVFTYIIYITDLRGKEHKIMGNVSIIR